MVWQMLKDIIHDYYWKRGLKWPKDSWEALGWLQTELGEVYELLLSRKGGWIRNSPDGKEAFDLDRLGEELGDALMMVMVAGMVEGVDPEQFLIDKIKGKLDRQKPTVQQAALEFALGNVSFREYMCVVRDRAAQIFNAQMESVYNKSRRRE